MKNVLFDIPIENQNKDSILEKILIYIHHPEKCVHIVSLNPEIFMETKNNAFFKKVVTTAQIRIVDGSGVLAAAHLKGVPIGPRFTGVALMKELLKMSNKQRLRILLLGGKENVAERIIDCQLQAQSKAKFRSSIGIIDRQNPTQAEEDAIRAIVTDFKPQIVLVSFGSPYQEMWIYNHRELLKGAVCAGVGGAFDFIAGVTPRASKVVQLLGVEYMYRLFQEPWRWRRQLNVIIFGILSVIEAAKYRILKK